jgi:hypothetical protein
MIEEAELWITHEVCFVVAAAFEVKGVVLKAIDDLI